jgi:GxxExxY protein
MVFIFLSNFLNRMDNTRKGVNALSFKVVGAAIEVHKHLGPGLLESIYQKCLALELLERGINFQQEVEIPISYKGHLVQGHLKCDFFIENLLVIELKAVSEILPIHHAQLINYMNLLKAPKGILLNFNVIHLFSHGQKTFLSKYFASLPEWV